LSEILENLVPVRADWDQILLFLKVPAGEIQSIRTERFNQTDRCLMDGLTYWLHGNTKNIKKAPKVNWRSLLDALRVGLVAKPAVADQLERKFRDTLSER